MEVTSNMGSYYFSFSKTDYITNNGLQIKQTITITVGPKEKQT